MEATLKAKKLQNKTCICLWWIKTPAAIFINDNGDIKISTDLGKISAHHTSVTAVLRKISEFLNQFRARTLLSVLYQKIQSLYMANPADSTIPALQGEGAKEMGVMKDYIKDYIVKSPAPARYFMPLI